MKKILLLTVATFVIAGIGNANAATAKKQTMTPMPDNKNIVEKYDDFKDMLDKDYGFTYNIAITSVAQRGSPSGQITPIQMLYYGDANWDMFKSDLGDGSIQAVYTKARYSGRQASELDDTLGVASDINDFSGNANYFYQLTYTHTLPGEMKWLSFSFGQFPLYLFDGNPYLSDQQAGFMNLAFTQNGTYSYPSAGIGSFITAKPSDEWTFYTGFQDANNVSGEKMKFSTFNDGDYTTFASIVYTPTNKLGKGHYGFMVYNQPKVDERPQESNGWSLSASQDIGDKWAVFSRINGSTHEAYLKRSYALGMVYKDPLERGNDLDRIGFAGAINEPQKNMWDSDDVRSSETVFDLYWNYGIGKHLVITPDLQYYIKPALNPDHDSAIVYSIRATVFF